jgi:hypothetical protein
MKVDKIAKGTAKQFAKGGRTPMLGKGDRTKSANPAKTQRPGRTAQPASRRVGAKP